MRKLLISMVAAVAMVVGFAPLAQAVAPVTASPDTIYPYVLDGYLDYTTITFSSVEDTHLVVFDSSDVQVFSKDTVSALGFTTWGGEKTGGGLVPADSNGELYKACIFVDGSDDSAPLAENCDTVLVVHSVVYSTEKVIVKGNSFYSQKVIGDCKVIRQGPSALIKCKDDSAAVLRYRITKPVLTSHQRFDGQALCKVIGPVFRWGDGVYAARTNQGARVVGLDKFWGKVRELHKTFFIIEEW